MKKTRVGINGFGRIGRVTTRLLFESSDFELVAINDLTPTDQNVHLLKYDSVHGPWDHPVSADKDTMKIGSQTVKVFGRRDPVEIPWKELGVDLVFECTGIFTNYEGASKHLKAGAKKVVVSAP